MKHNALPKVVIKDPFTYNDNPTLLEGMLFVRPRRRICENRPLKYGLFAVLALLLVLTYLQGRSGVESLGLVGLLMMVVSLDFYEAHKKNNEENDADVEEEYV